MLLPDRLERAKALLQNCQHVALATVNEDGSPHNSPVFAAFGSDLQMYWSSDPAAQHSRNIIRSGQVFIVLFDQDQGGGLYIEAVAEPVPLVDLEKALYVFNKAKRRCDSIPLSRDHVTKGPQRLYQARPKNIFINQADKDETGAIIEDKKYSITMKDLQDVYNNN